MSPNALKEWMDFANANNIFGQGYQDRAGSYDPSGQRALWAARMASNGGGDHPDFFAEEPRNAMMEFAPRMERPMRAPMEDPLRPQIRNYIARMLGGR